MISETDFIANHYSTELNQGNFIWSAPSNIALVKYWGKKQDQIPANQSISFTLNKCKTITKFGSGGYLEIDIPLTVPDDKDCNDDKK